ncbi:GMC oxidoreductase [Scytonema hofmannii]|uniref:GMC oxidoreductase n=1 Tax=Scytonema hofmannii TaxID=34078 RepID=UPI0013142389|nr:GMC oxidoreductase [Scytonema hofmannii]
MDFVPYHSGSVGSLQESETAFANQMIGARSFIAAPVKKFYVKFRTQSYRPNHLVTIRNNVDGWWQDIYGAYYNSEWVFFLEESKYRNGLKIKFVLDRQVWMEGEDIQLQPFGEHIFTEKSVFFGSVPPRYLHGYDNLRTDDSKLQQDAIPRNNDETIEYDVVIIGSGMGGGILADAISDKGRRVLVLEAGSLLYPTHMTNLPGDWSRLPSHHQVGHFTNEPGSEFLSGVQMNFGGRSIFWSGLIPRMHDWEILAWPESIGQYLKSSQGYDRAEKLMRKQKTLGRFQNRVVSELQGAFSNYKVEDLPRSRHQPNLDNQGSLENVLEASTGTFSTASLLLDSLSFNGPVGRDNLTINLNHLVTHIETDGSKAVAVVCQDLIGNQQRRYRAKRIVLAAGSLETPRIAMGSKLSDPNQKIGVGLTDHPAFFSNTYELDLNSPYNGFENHAKILMYHKQATTTEHPYNVELLINPKYWDVAHADDDVWKQEVAKDQKTTTRLQFVFASPLDDRNQVFPRGEGQKLGVMVNRNPSGSNLFNEVRELRNSILEFLQAPHNPNDGMHFGNEGTVHHAGGSMRMSRDRTGVVDENLRMEAYDNLYVCDVSVFPIIPAANPCLTLAALTLRLADHLVQLL